MALFGGERMTESLRGLRLIAGRAGWIVPFGYYVPVTAVLIVHFLSPGNPPGQDAVLYRSAAVAFLQGSDPWAVGTPASHFAGTPATILAFMPMTLIPEEAWRAISIVLNGLIAGAIMVRLRLSLAWLLYPPISIAVLIGQPALLLMGLLLSPLAALAPLINPYGGVPLLWRHRALAVAIALGVATVLIAPGLWVDWIQRLPAISSRLALELHDAEPLWLIMLGALALLVVVKERPQHAPWLAVSALWPLPEYHYAILAMPTALPLVLFGLAIVPGSLTVVLYAAWLLASRYGLPRIPALRIRPMSG